MTGRAYATDGRPGFMGHGRNFIASKPFASAEGGTQRIVPMPKELKDSTGSPKRKKHCFGSAFLWNKSRRLSNVKYR